MEQPTITAKELWSRSSEKCELHIFDLRSEAEFHAGHIPAAIHLPWESLRLGLEVELSNRNADVVLYCAEGVRSAQVRQLLQQMGYSRVRHLEAGYASWRALGLPVERSRDASFSANASDRYSRQMLLGPIGKSGQKKLSAARVLLVGVGGLGSPAALYLAGAGVGTLGLVDSDFVDLSNLHRQIIHDTSGIGTPKVESARSKIEAVNPDVTVLTYPERFTNDNAERIFADGWDVVIDGADNFQTRYVLNDVARQYAVPVCHGSVDRFEGRVTTFLANSGPCYRCLFPKPPAPEAIGACAERGVLGVLPGVVGVLQGTEAIKLIVGLGKPLMGRLLTYDALDMEFRQIRFARDADCPTCAKITTRA